MHARTLEVPADIFLKKMLWLKTVVVVMVHHSNIPALLNYTYERKRWNRLLT